MSVKIDEQNVRQSVTRLCEKNIIRFVEMITSRRVCPIREQAAFVETYTP